MYIVSAKFSSVWLKIYFQQSQKLSPKKERQNALSFASSSFIIINVFADTLHYGEFELSATKFNFDYLGPVLPPFFPFQQIYDQTL